MTKTLQGLSLGEPSLSGSIFMFPILGGTEASPTPLSFDQALQAEVAEIHEKSLAGEVSEVVIENRGPAPVFLLDGEQILGLKQNRTFNLSMLIPAASRVPIPVSCLELGRWAHHADRARPAEHVHFASGRANKLRSVSESLRNGRQYHSDQGKVWADIDQKLNEYAFASETSAEADVFLQRRSTMEGARIAMPRQSGQCGLAVGVGDQLIGVDLFLSPALYANFHDKLLRSYLLDDGDQKARAVPPSRSDVLAMIQSLFCGAEERFKAPGLGETLRWTTPSGSAAALIADGKCLHAVGFSNSAGDRSSRRMMVA